MILISTILFVFFYFLIGKGKVDGVARNHIGFYCL